MRAQHGKGDSIEQAVIIDAVRTPVGRRGGQLSGWHPIDLTAEVLSALVSRTGIDPAAVDDVILGCVDQVGEQGVNAARWALLGAGFPDTVPGTTIDRQCGSSQQAAHFAAQGVMAGAYDMVIACGVESMTRVPMFANLPNPADAYGSRVRARYGLGASDFIHQGESGELIADRWEIDRDALDVFAAESHHRAAQATAEGRFAREIHAVTVDQDGSPVEMTADQGIRASTTVDALAALKPVFRDDGRLTAGNSSQISDGAAALLITSERVAQRLGLTPLARFHTFALAGVDPVEMLSGPIPATRLAFERSGLGADDIGLFEVNEAFASVPLAWMKDLNIDVDRVNVNGGAIALGHPLGCSGARLMTTLVHAMTARRVRYGLQTMCEGGGTANATILELI